jgi:Transposase DDE domain
MSRPNTPTYKTVNWPAYNRALKRRGSLTIWFDPGMAWAAKPTGKRGRQPVYSDAAVQTCLTMKVLFGMVDIGAPLVRATMSTRQTTGFVESLLCLIGLDWDVPDFSTLSRRQKTLAVTIPHRGSQDPLHLLIDIEPVSATGSSEPARGIKVEGEGEWNARKHGGAKRRVWRKVHLGIDEQTLETRAVEVTSNDIGDAPLLPELLSQIPPDQEIASVTADGAYDTRKCHDASAERGAQAVIPPRKNAKPWKADSAGAAARNETLRASKYLGRALWRRWSGYHRRSRVEM